MPPIRKGRTSAASRTRRTCFDRLRPYGRSHRQPVRAILPTPAPESAVCGEMHAMQRTYEDAGAKMETSMNSPAPNESPFAHDLFISYSRKDLQFAQLLERALATYSP